MYFLGANGIIRTIGGQGDNTYCIANYHIYLSMGILCVNYSNYNNTGFSLVSIHGNGGYSSLSAVKHSERVNFKLYKEDST